MGRPGHVSKLLTAFTPITMNIWTILALVIAGPLLVGLFIALVMFRLGRDLDEDARRRAVDELLDLNNRTD